MGGRAGRGIAVLCTSALLLCGGCGYRAGFTMPDGVGTIHVGVFENRTFYREYDFELTQLVKREILSRTDLTVVREKEADVVLSCVLEHVEKSILKEDENDLPEEVQLKVTISARATDRDGNVLFEVPNLSRSVRYAVVLGESERIARARALREVAEELVYRMAENWSWRRAAPEADAGEEDAGGEQEDVEDVIENTQVEENG